MNTNPDKAVMMLEDKCISELRVTLINRRKELVEYRHQQKTTWEKIEKSEKDYYDKANLESILSEISELDERRWNEIVQIDAALDRIEEGMFGICETCDEFIGLARMKALPYARMCVNCAQSRERMGSLRGIPLTDAQVMYSIRT